MQRRMNLNHRSGLMGSANSSTIIAVEIFVKVNVVAKMWIAL